MRITVDPALTPPEHSVSKADLKVLFSKVPKDWIAELKLVRLLNSLPTNSNGPPAFVWCGDLAICSRGRAKKLVLTEILMQLAQQSLGWNKRRGVLTHAERGKLHPMIAPVLEKVLVELGEPAKKAGISLRGFVELKFPLK